MFIIKVTLVNGKSDLKEFTNLDDFFKGNSSLYSASEGKGRTDDQLFLTLLSPSVNELDFRIALKLLPKVK